MLPNIPFMVVNTTQFCCFTSSFFTFFTIYLRAPRLYTTQCLLTKQIPKPRNGWGPHEHPVFSSIKTGVPRCTSKLGDFGVDYPLRMTKLCGPRGQFFYLDTYLTVGFDLYPLQEKHGHLPVPPPQPSFVHVGPQQATAGSFWEGLGAGP